MWLLSLMFYQIIELFVRKLNTYLYNQKIHNWIQVQHEICSWFSSSSWWLFICFCLLDFDHICIQTKKKRKNRLEWTLFWEFKFMGLYKLLVTLSQFIRASVDTSCWKVIFYAVEPDHFHFILFLRLLNYGSRRWSLI